MSIEENKAIIRRQIEEMWNKGKLELVDEFFTSDFVGHDPFSSEEIQGPEGFKQFVATSRASLPDLHMRIEDQVAEGDRVATRYLISGTHEGEIQGIPPTGNWVEVSGTGIDRISGGKIAESWEHYDALGMLQQLGVIPSPEEQASQD